MKTGRHCQLPICHIFKKSDSIFSHDRLSLIVKWTLGNPQLELILWFIFWPLRNVQFFFVNWEKIFIKFPEKWLSWFFRIFGFPWNVSHCRHFKQILRPLWILIFFIFDKNIRQRNLPQFLVSLELRILSVEKLNELSSIAYRSRNLLEHIN